MVGVPRAGSFGRWAVIVAAGILGGMVALPAAAAAQPVGPSQLNATDIALLHGVRLAGLWEIPAGQMAADKGSSDRVRKIGAEIAAQHVELDQLAVDAANALGAQLPADPTPDQQKWLAEMRQASGERFDRIFVDRLRAAHGSIFPVIGAVRASTRNAQIRELAQAANGFVMDHLTMLESTGLVRYNELPPAAVPIQDSSLVAIARANTGIGSGLNPVAVWAVLLVALLLAGTATVRVFRGR